jgi:hypothetical protein
MKKKKAIRNKGEVMSYLDTSDDILDHRIASVITEEEYLEMKETCGVLDFGYSQVLRFFLKYGLTRLHGQSTSSYDATFDLLIKNIDKKSKLQSDMVVDLMGKLDHKERKKLIEQWSKEG